MSDWFSKHICHPVWDIKDRSVRLRTLWELERTQWLTTEVLIRRQWEKLLNIIGEAYENCSYYRSLFDELGIVPSDIKNGEDFTKIPILTKQHVQAHVGRLISRKYQRESLISSKTGGSTGTALMLYFDKKCEERRNAAAIRSDRWAGWDLGMKRAAIWGNPPVADTFKRKVRDALFERAIYLDTMNINPGSVDDFVKHWRRYRPQVIFGHSHSIYMLANYLEERGIKDLRPRGIVSTSMMLLPHEREVIKRVFSCQVTDRYGCEEVGLIACECERHQGLHLNIDHVYVEFLKKDGMPAKPGEEGVIVVTDLLNRGMPLIRYQVEDVGIPSDRPCPCGRGLPLIEHVSGRIADFLVKRDGALVAGVSLVERTVTAIPGIQQMQIVQEQIDRLVLNVVRMSGYGPSSELALLSEFRGVFGKEIGIELRYVDKIRQEPSGKYRFSICKVARTS